MRLTPDIMALAFPAIDPEAPPGAFRASLFRQLCAFTDNIGYAEDMTDVIRSHIDDAPYSALPQRLQSYRASVDLFLMVAPEPRIVLYLRAIGLTLSMKRSPRRFHQALLAKAREYNLPIPTPMLAPQGAPVSVDVHLRLPLPVHHALLAKAHALGTTLSTLIREALYKQENIS